MLTWYIRIIHSPMALNVTFTLCDVFPSGLAVKTNTSWFIHSFKVIKIRKKYPISKNLVESSLIHLSWYDIRSHLRNKILLSIFFLFIDLEALYNIGWTYRCQERGDEAPAQHPPVFEGDERDATAKRVTSHQFDVVQESEDTCMGKTLPFNV